MKEPLLLLNRYMSTSQANELANYSVDWVKAISQTDSWPDLLKELTRNEFTDRDRSHLNTYVQFNS